MSQIYKNLAGGGGPIPPQVPESFVTDVNSPAIPAANVLNVPGRQTNTNNDKGVQTDGSSGGNTLTVQLTNRQTGTVTTGNAALTTIISFALGTTPGTFYIYGNVQAFNAVTPASGAYSFSAGYRTDGATASVLGTVFHDEFEDVALTTSDIFINQSSNNVLIQVQGVVGLSINWNALIEFKAGDIMAGNSSIRGDQTVTFTDNLSFDGTDRGGAMTTDGQLWIGATASNRANNGGHVRLGSITSPDGSVTIGYSAPNITIQSTGGLPIVKFAVDVTTGAGTNPVLPNGSGQVTITGGQYTTGTFGTRVITIDSTAANTFAVQAQISSANAVSLATKNGLSHFDSARFTVDANGFVSANGSGLGETITGDSGGALSPTAGNWNIIANVAAQNCGSTVKFSGAVSTLTLNVTDGFANTSIGNTSGGSLNGAGGAVQNTFLGSNSGGQVSTGFLNTLLGYRAGSWGSGGITTGTQNTIVGGFAGGQCSNMSNCTLLGAYAGFNLSGSNNVFIGEFVGSSVTTGDSNIIIGTGITGAAATANSIIIGAQGSGAQQQNYCQIAGIAGVKVSNLNLVTINTATGQLGSEATSSFGQTITGDSGGALSPSSGNWSILGRSGSKTSGSGSTLTVKSPPYADAGGSATSTLNSGSFVTAAVTLTLPASAGLADGDLFEFVCTTAGALIIQAVSAQKIRLGALISSAAGTITSTSIGDAVVLRFRATDGFFYATSIIGTWTIA